LVADLVAVSGPLLIHEIMEMIGGLDLMTEREIEQKNVEGFLFLLEKLGHLTKTRAGNYDFYVPSKTDTNFISYLSAAGKSIKWERLAADISKIIPNLPGFEYRKAAYKSAPKMKVAR
jgi:hypothetical protein